MAEIKTIYKGESVTILFTFPETYDMTRLTSQKIFIGETEFIGEIEWQAIRLRLKSSDTDKMIGAHKIFLWIDEAVLGLRKNYCGDLVIAKTLAAGSTTSVSNISDIIIPVIISEAEISVGDILYNYMKGLDAFHVWLEQNTGKTYDDYIAFLREPVTSLIAGTEALVTTWTEQEADRVEAELLREENTANAIEAANTATQNTIIATNSMLSNLISLEIRDDLCLWFETPDTYTGMTFDIENGNLVATL